jgi:chemotaxis signal transduction protein
VVRGPGGEAQVPIDRFVGIRPALTSELKRLPAFLDGIVEPALIGFLMQPERIVLLIDLQALVSEPSAVGGGAGEQRARAS